MTSARALSAADDDFHPGDSPWQTEGSWWCFFARERQLAGWIYHLTRPNLGIASGGVWVWDSTCHLWYEVPYFGNWNFQLLDDSPRDLNHFIWPDGVALDTLDPLRRYHLSFHDGELLDLDLTYEGVMEPYVACAGDTPTPFRFDHPSRVTGEVVLRGERIAVDSFAMRDHSWGVRPDAPNTGRTLIADPAALAERPAPYLWATASTDDAFFVMGGKGWLVRGDTRAALTVVEQRLERDPTTGLLRSIAIEGNDESGRVLHASGVAQSIITRPSGSGIGFTAAIDWSIDGVSAIGDVQDVWPLDAWSTFRTWQRTRA